MISVKITQNTVSVTGHADPIVCAAVSANTEFLSELLRDPRPKVLENTVEMRHGAEDRKYISAFAKCLIKISEDYPNNLEVTSC